MHRRSRNEIFAQLFSDSREALRRYARRFVKSSDAAEEIVQEAFLRTYRRFDSVATPRAFLFSTVRNLAWKKRRHELIAKTDSVGDIDESRVVTSCESLDEGLLADERARLLEEAVERLPRQCRAAFALKVFHACSYQEIADRLGISTKTVEKHIARGLRDTHAHLQRRYREVSKDHG